MAFDAGPQVAIEFDLFDANSRGISILRLCNFGPLFTITDLSQNYEDRLIPPILLGTSISVQSYGQPMRALANQGTIEFRLDESYALKIFDDSLHWVGRTFRVYEGQQSPRGYVEDLELVYSGRVTDVTHDTLRATIRTGDASVDLDVPLVTVLYPDDALPAIAGKPKSEALGTVICVEPTLIDSVDVVYDVSTIPIQAIFDLRVGGISWGQSAIFPPGEGEWYFDPITNRVTLGSATLGGDVRMDVGGFAVAGVGGLGRVIVESHGLAVDADAIALTNLYTVGYYAKDPVNTLNALDDIFTGAACWWGLSPLGLVTAGVIAPPAALPDVPTVLDRQNVKSLSLSQTLPPAWRIRVEFERHWQTEGQFFDAIEESDKQRWSAPGLVVTREDPLIKFAEPRAIDVPTMRSVAVTAADGNAIADAFWAAWSVRRVILDVTAWIDPREINLYDTITVDYMMFRKNFRIISAIRSIGGGAAQLQLWG